MAKIALFSSGDVHGAYEAIYRIASFLKDDGHDVAMLVRFKTKNDGFIRVVNKIIIEKPYIRPAIFKRILWKLRLLKRPVPPKPDVPPVIETDEKYLFIKEDESYNYYTTEEVKAAMPFVPDLIISGMTDQFINTSILADLGQAYNCKVSLLTVDMHPFTGGCHYSWDCIGYQTDCSDCPAMNQSQQKDWARNNLAIKKRNIERANIQIIAGSGWTLNQARNSSLFKNQKEILNTNSCIDTRLFNDRNRDIAKRVFDIPTEGRLIFTGSLGVLDPRKGFSYFAESLNILWERLEPNLRDHIYILVVGKDAHNETISKIPFKKIAIDYIKDYRLLVLAYQAADIFVCASIEDSGPMMVSEALACGTPVVGFDMGIVYNMVENGYNGYKAKLKDSHDLAQGLKTILKLPEDQFATYSSNAVKQVEKYSSHIQLVSIINKILNS